MLNHNGQPVLDIKLLRDISEYSLTEEQFVSLIRKFSDEGEQLIQALLAQTDRQSSNKNKVSLHKLRSMSVSIGATRLSELCANVHDMDISTFNRSKDALCEELIKLHRQAVDKLGDLVKELYPHTQ